MSPGYVYTGEAKINDITQADLLWAEIDKDYSGYGPTCDHDYNVSDFFLKKCLC